MRPVRWLPLLLVCVLDLAIPVGPSAAGTVTVETDEDVLHPAPRPTVGQAAPAARPPRWSATAARRPSAARVVPFVRGRRLSRGAEAARPRPSRAGAGPAPPAGEDG